jgi:hypothetical protein
MLDVVKTLTLASMGTASLGMPTSIGRSRSSTAAVDRSAVPALAIGSRPAA